MIAPLTELFQGMFDSITGFTPSEFDVKLCCKEEHNRAKTEMQQL